MFRSAKVGSACPCIATPLVLPDGYAFDRRAGWASPVKIFLYCCHPNLERCPGDACVKKECASLGPATASFCCRNSTGTLEHETQDRKESYHGNCGKQVGE